MAHDPEQDIVGGISISEDLAARTFAEKYMGRIAYDFTRGLWYEFDGSIWRAQETPTVFHLAREMCRRLSNDAKNGDALLKLRFVMSVEKFAQSDPVFSRTTKFWNQDKYLLGTPSGTVDLTTGKLRSARAIDGITKAAFCAPSDHEDCPTWHAFLEQATGGDEALIRFLQQIAGYCLTGETNEQALFFLYGTGGNGKGVFIGVLLGILADYAQTAGMEMLEKKPFQAHATELAVLQGARLVTASETDEGGEWNEKRVKQMTGQDPIRANFMRQDSFEYLPEFKLLIAGNHEPSLRAVDEAMRRRFNIIPFTNKPAQKDPELGEKLKAEYPGILRWMINGCIDWQEHRLIRPPSVLKATNEYFADQNTMAQWVEQECTVEPNNAWCQEKSSILFTSWVRFAKKNGLEPGNSKTFKPAMLRLGFEMKETKSANFWAGIKLKSGRDDD